MLRTTFGFCTTRTMPSSDQSTSKTCANAYASDKSKAAPLPPKTTKQPAAKPASITGSKRGVAEINYPDPLPGGFQPGKKSCEQPHPTACRLPDTSRSGIVRLFPAPK